MELLLNGKIYTRHIDDWKISWESNGAYRHWCYQRKEGFDTNLLVVMFNPGSLSDEGKRLKSDTTLRILREVCEPAKINPLIINLFDYSAPSPSMLFSNWEHRDADKLVYDRLESFEIAAYIMAYGNYENDDYDEQSINDDIKERIKLVSSKLSELKRIDLPLRSGGTPKHPMTWQIDKQKEEITNLLIAGINESPEN